MKFSIAALVAAAVATLTNADKCDYAVVGPSLHKLGQPIASCMTATGNSYNLARASVPPTPEQAAAICAKCATFVDTVSTLTWPDCTMNMGGKNQTITAYFDAMIGDCKSGGSGSAATTTATTVSSSTEKTTGDANKTEDASKVTVPSTPLPGTPAVKASAGYSVKIGVFAASAVATTIALAF